MGFLGVVFTFLGYLLTYASIANHGRFATTPWAAIFADAYDSSGGTTPTGTSPAPPTDQPAQSA